MTRSDYSPVTEKAGDWVTPEALSMVYTRYRFAVDFCRGRRVLEVACGPASGSAIWDGMPMGSSAGI